MLEAERDASIITPVRGVNTLRISQSFESSFVRQQRIEFVRSGGVPTSKENMLSVYVFSFIAFSMRFSLASVFAVATPDMIYLVSVSFWVSIVVLGNFSFSLRDDFLNFSLACPGVSKTISLMYLMGEMFTLKGFYIDLRLDIPFPSFFLL